MRITGRTWAIIAAALLLAMAVAVKLRPHRAAPAYVVTGTEPAGLEPKPIHDLRSEESVDGQRFLVTNLIDGPIQTRCRLVSAENAIATPPLPRSLVVPAKAERELSLIVPAEPGRRSQAEVECAAVVGDPGAAAPAGVAYAQPFYPGTAFTVAQGFNGAFSHRGAQAQFAIDLGVPEGTPVVAARAGVVMQVEDDFHGHGVDLEKYGDRANYVRVLHEDGSMALYAHLAPGTALVRPGEKVAVGGFLARSGDTGYTTGPHLHFVVQHNAGMELVSIPFTMAGVDTTDH